MWFSLNGTIYQNNSCIALEDIGQGDDALLCVTNLSACCRPNGSASGNWFFPNETKVFSAGVQTDLYRSIGRMIVLLTELRLNRKGGGEEGIYRCEIPDSTDVTQTLYIGVYTACAGE